MHDSPKVVYAAKNVQQAYLLKNTLEEAGIRAVVANASLESGSGVDYVGWNTLARVVVDEPDYEVARKIAMDYDRAGAEAALQQAPEEAGGEDDQGPVLHEWPRCPECGAERITRCPVCKTTGSEFPEADSEFVWGMGLAEIGTDEKGGEKGHGSDRCQCGSQGACATQQPAASPAPETELEHDDQPERIVLMCPTCDEPFMPEFPRDCAMCSHRFEDGFEVELGHAPPEQIGSRVVGLLVGMAALLIALAVYFMWVLR